MTYIESRANPRWASLLIALVFLLLSSCGLMVFDEERQMGERFISYIVTDNASEAHALLASYSDAMTAEKFEVLWAELRAFADGAAEAEVKDYRMDGSRSSVVGDRHHIYAVRLDNGRAFILDLFFDNGDLTTCTYRDTTAFARKTEHTVPILSVILIIYTTLALALPVWMLVDCARRRIKCKALWIVLNLAALSLTFTFGEQVSFSLLISLFLRFSSISASWLALGVTVKLIIPVGSIVYFLLRKRLTLPPKSVIDSPADPASPEI